jgi:trk system potassium uptake protein TrkH
MRSTGFLSVQFNNLQLASIFMMMIIGFIGSSPGSTGSGIKTTTFAIILATTKAIFSGREFVYIKRRKIKKIQVYRSVAIVIVALTWITITTFLLLIIEKNHPFLDVLFESVAAFSNLGITSGLTPTLTNVGKLLIAASEIAGRIGSLTLILAFAKTTGERDFLYPEERIMLG